MGEERKLKNNDLENIKQLKGAKKSQKNKSVDKVTAKKIGLKSTLIYDGKLALTSFANAKTGDKNATNVEQISSYFGDTIYSKNPILFNADVSEQEIVIKPINRAVVNKDLPIPNPAKMGVKKDYVGIKGVLENKYFGKIHNDDNIHVQIAYNVADIKKIMIPYLEQIIYLCYNLNRKERDLDLLKKKDVIGTLYYANPLSRFRVDPDTKPKTLQSVNKLLENYSVYNTYFSDLFKVPKKGKNNLPDPKSVSICDEHNFNVFRTLSMIRQACVHAKISGTASDPERLLYDANACKREQPDLYAFIDNLANRAFEKTNADFCNNAKNNLYVLSKVYPHLTAEELIQSYYHYVVIKEDNNLGMNLRLLREIMIYYHLPELKDKKYDNYRNKLYTIMGFIIYNHVKGSELLEETVVKLRAVTSEEKRLEIYTECATSVWQSLNEVLQKAISALENEIARKESDVKAKLNGMVVEEEQIKGCIKNASKLSYFSKILLFVTNFLNGKEINELLCGFINKFDGIADLIYSAKKCGCNITFVAGYKELEKAREIANDLRLIKNIARMKRDPNNISGQMMIDAVKLLGITSNVLDEEDLYQSTLLKEESDRLLDRIYKNEQNKQMRNFLINNVIKSKWFFYIVRYIKPENCRMIMRNHKMVSFAIKEINDTQIVRYYQAVTGTCLNEKQLEDGRKMLAKMLSEFNIDSVMSKIENMNEYDYKDNTPQSAKERCKALVTLYLTVAYLIVKNVVRTNTSFNVAMSCWERDSFLMGLGTEDMLSVTKRFLDNDEVLVEDYNKKRDSIRVNNKLSREQKRKEYKKALQPILKQMHFSLHHYYCIKANYDRAVSLNRTLPNGKTANIIKNYRNNVAHLNVVNAFPVYIKDIGEITSYYDVYVYAMQRMLLDEQLAYANEYNDALTDFSLEYDKLIKEYKGYVKDLSWILNVPFAYNVARYKNLSIKELFYGDISKEKIPSPTVEEIKVAVKDEIVEAPVVEEEVEEEEVELAYGYFSGQTVTMGNIEVNSRGGLRGIIVGTNYKITVPPSVVQESGIDTGSLIGKELEVRIVDWSKGGNSFSSEIV